MGLIKQLSCLVCCCFIFSGVSKAQDPEWALLDENVGIGVGDPESKLHVKGGSATKLLVENSEGQTSGEQVMFELRNAAANKVRFLITTGQSNTWSFDNNPFKGAFSISRLGTGANEFEVYSNGNGLFRGTSTAVNHVNTSSRNVKADFSEIDPVEVLSKLNGLPILEWRYKMEEPEIRHIGPIAEDFQAVFDIGDGKTISTVDASGVAFAAIKGLLEKLGEKEAEIQSLKENLRAQSERMDRIEKLLLSMN